MKTSDLIKKLQDFMAENGDLEVGLYDHEYDFYNTLDTVSIRDLGTPGRRQPDADKLLGNKFVGLP